MAPGLSGCMQGRRARVDGPRRSDTGPRRRELHGTRATTETRGHGSAAHVASRVAMPAGIGGPLSRALVPPWLASSCTELTRSSHTCCCMRRMPSRGCGRAPRSPPTHGASRRRRRLDDCARVGSGLLLMAAHAALHGAPGDGNGPCGSKGRGGLVGRGSRDRAARARRRGSG
jgi:hypothetical protein